MQGLQRDGRELSEALVFFRMFRVNKVLKLIRQWLHECTSYHPYCQSNSAVLPTRVSDVGPAESKEPPLFQTRGERGPARDGASEDGSTAGNMRWFMIRKCLVSQ